MDQNTTTRHVAFLQGTWRAVLHDQPEPFHKRLLQDYVSNEVMARLPEQTTLRNVLQECHSLDAFQESYIKSFLGLRKSWEKLTPESRHTIIQYVNKCGLQQNNGLQPLPDDEAALTIRWDAANRLYAASREAAFKACRSAGLELSQPRGLPRPNDFQGLVRRGQETLLALLRERINIDKTAVTLAVGYVTPVARTKILGNLTAAAMECTDSFRAALVHWLLYHTPMQAAGAQAPDESQLREHVDAALVFFRSEVERLRAGVDEMPEDPTIYEKARHAIDGKPTLN